MTSDAHIDVPMNPPTLEERRADVLEDVWDVVDLLTEQMGYAPTIREVGDALGHASSSTTFYWLRRARAAGLVTWEDGKVRTLRCL